MPAKRAKNSSRHRATPDPRAREVGKRIQALRKAQEWKFDAWVEELGLGRGYVSELERGLVVPSLTALARIADALELTIADLVLADSLREELFELTRDLTHGEVEELLAQARRLSRGRDSST